jgi:hypothetical protein
LDHNVIVVEGVAGTIGTQPHQVLVVWRPHHAW